MFDLFRGPAPDRVEVAADEPLSGDRLSDREQLRLLREALSLSQEAFALSDLDQGGVFLDCSLAAHQRLGYTRGP